MKHWTKHHFREGGTLEAQGYIAEAQAARASATTLDRTQVPPESIGVTQLITGAMQRTWLLDMNLINTSNPGEQGSVRSDSSIQLPYSWEAITYNDCSGAPEGEGSTFMTRGVTGGREGVYLITVKGNYLVHPYFNNAAAPINPKRLGLILRWHGVSVCETWGFTHPCGSFVLSVPVLGQTGTNTLSLAWVFPAPGPNDSVLFAGTTYPVVQAHLWGMQALIEGQWR